MRPVTVRSLLCYSDFIPLTLVSLSFSVSVPSKYSPRDRRGGHTHNCDTQHLTRALSLHWTMDISSFFFLPQKLAMPQLTRLSHFFLYLTIIFWYEKLIFPSERAYLGLMSQRACKSQYENICVLREGEKLFNRREPR